MPKELTDEDIGIGKELSDADIGFEAAPIPDFTLKPTAESMLIDPATHMKRESGMESGTGLVTAVGSALSEEAKRTADYLGPAAYEIAYGDKLAGLKQLVTPPARAAGSQLESFGEGVWNRLNPQGDVDWEELRKASPKLMAVPEVVRGLVKSTPKMAAQALVAAVQPELSPAIWGLTPEGFDPVTAGTMYVLPWTKSYGESIAKTVAQKLGVTGEAAQNIVQKAAGGTAMAGLLTATDIAKLASMPEAQRREAAPEVIGNALAMFATGALEKQGNRPIPPITGEALEPDMRRGATVQPRVPIQLPDVAPERALEAASELPVAPAAEAPKASPHDFVPAFDQAEGPAIPGEKGVTHNDIIAAQTSKDPAWRIANLEKLATDSNAPESGRGFMYNGKFVTREEAAKLLGEEHTQENPFSSERLRDLQDKTPVPESPKSKPIATEFQELADKRRANQPMTDAENRRLDELQARDTGTKNAKAEFEKWKAELAARNAAANPEAPTAAAANPAEAPPAPAVEAKAGDAVRAAAAAIRRLKSETGTGLASFPAGIGDVVWNGAVEVAAKTLEAGGAIADAVEAAVKHIRENSKEKFDEADVRARFMGAVPPAESQPVEGLGGASLGEVGSGAGGDTFGIAARVREQRAAAGQTEPVAPGKGIGAEESVEHGRELLAQGRSAESTLEEFNRLKNVSAEGMALVRAKGEELAGIARKAEEQFGTDSPQFREARQKLVDWDKAIKPMQTEWHKIGMAQQGETDIDTGTFTGLDRAYHEATDRDFTPGQKKQATRIAKGVKDATDSTDASRQSLFSRLRQKRSNPEKDALDAANKVVRDNAVRIADAENKRRSAEQALETARQNIQPKAAQSALAAAQQQARKAGIDLAKADNDKRIAATSAAKDQAEVQAKAAKKALDAANKVIRDSASGAAKAENLARIAQAKRDLQTAQIQEKAARKAHDAVTKVARKAAVRAAKAAQKLQSDPSLRAWETARSYLEKGEDNFDDIRNKVATDLGMKADQVARLLAQDKRTKYLADDLWQKQQRERILKSKAKRWVVEQAIPTLQRNLMQVPRTMFGIRVGFHGTVALGTHAPMVAFQPRFWAAYVRNYGRMYRMVNPKGGIAYYEMQVQDLQRRPNYITARRAGLVNDPAQFEDYNSPDVAKYFSAITGMGNRGYSVLKMLRQDMFDQHWNRLPKTSQIPEVAEAIANGINHATGVTKAAAPKGLHVGLFAPRLEASRAAWLAVDPAKAVGTFLNWKNASEGEKYFAVNQVKEKAWVAGTLLGMLALNQGVLSAINSKQKVNFDDPFKSDWLKFKVAGMTISYGNAMLTMARLPVRLYYIREGGTGKMKNLISPDESIGNLAVEYTRSQLSPFASLAMDLFTKSDWQGRPLPGSTRQVPKRLLAQGVKPYTWQEFWTQQALPIPAQEAVHDVWKTGLGMSEQQEKQMAKGMATLAVMMATGARVADDVPYKVNKP